MCLQAMCLQDKQLLPYYKAGHLECGCDEAGRGCLAGPVFAAAVVFPMGFNCEALNDSKQLTEAERYRLRPLIEQSALSWAVASVDAAEIDEINILNASFLAMNKAVKQLNVVPDLLLIDGNRFRNATGIMHLCVVKGDATYQSIAAASILAKTYRDDYMRSLHQQYSQYGWDINKGYPTKSHYAAIAQYGISPFHRKTYRLYK